MILGRILDLLLAQKIASLGEIAQAVDSSPDAVRSMLETLQRRGLVHRLQTQGGCGSSCRRCAQGTVEVYGHGAAPLQSVAVGLCAGNKLRA